MNYEQHPLSGAFPPMSDDDYLALKADIKANGQREPIMLYEGKILDGIHRYQVCSELEIKPTFFTFQGADPVAYVKSLNLHRRHLTASQRANAVVACSEWQAAHRPAQAVKRLPVTNKQALVPTYEKPKTNAEMAVEAGVSERTIKDAKVAHTAGMGDAVRKGEMSVKEAARQVRGTPETPMSGGATENPASIPTPVTIPKEAPVPEVDDELQEKCAFLSEENDRLNDRLAVVAMDATDEERNAAEALIADLRAQVSTLTAELDAVKSSRDTLMNSAAEMQKSMNSMKRKLEKFEKNVSPA